MFISVGQTDVIAGVKLPTKTDANFYKTDAFCHHSSFYEKKCSSFTPKALLQNYISSQRFSSIFN